MSARKGHLIVRYGKNGKYREVPLHPKLRAVLEEWLRERSSWKGADTTMTRQGTDIVIVAERLGHTVETARRRYSLPTTTTAKSHRTTHHRRITRPDPRADPAPDLTERPTMPDNSELIIRIHPLGGDDVTVATTDFAEPAQALQAIAHALDEHHSLTLTQAHYNREPDTNAVVINLANVISVRVSSKDSATTGQYL